MEKIPVHPDLWRLFPHTFAERASAWKWKPYPYLRWLSLEIEKAVREGNTRIIVSMPPRHGKSEMISFWTPLWFLSKHPDKNVILASYEAELAQHWGRRVRNEAVGNPLIGIQVSADSSASDRWNTKQGGGMLTAGVGGGILGRGGHLQIIDDPYKNWQDATSPTIQTRTIDWFQSTFWTRREPGSVVIVNMQRWNSKDLVAFLETDPDHKGKWKTICLPALADNPEDPLGRPIDAALCPERYSREELLEIKAAIGSMKFSAMYQQRPTSIEGGIVKRDWIQFYRALPDGLSDWTISADLTFKDSSKADFTVFQVWARDRARRFLVDQVRDRMSFTSAIKAFRAISAKYPQATRKLVEEKANGSALIDTLRNEIEGIIAINPKESKDARLADASVFFEAGNVYFPDPTIAPWVNDNVEEVVTFPNAGNDDTVDATTQYLNDSKVDDAALNRLAYLTSM